jgi:hypothetical protein
MEPDRRKMAAVDAEGWASHFPLDQAEIASVWRVEPKFRISRDNHVINAVARSAGNE